MTTHLTHLQCPYLADGNVVGLAIGLALCNGDNGHAPCVVIQVYVMEVMTYGIMYICTHTPWQPLPVVGLSWTHQTFVHGMVEPLVSISVYVHVWTNPSSHHCY